MGILVAMLLGFLAGCATPGMGGKEKLPEVSTVPDALRESLGLSPFYQKYLDLDGFPILGSTNVSDYAIKEAAWILSHMLAYRPEILQVMATNRARLVVMAYNEYTTDVPEQRNRTPKIYWDRRARGLGGRVCSCAEENLLCFPGDPYSTENILIHEFAHAIESVGLRSLDPDFRRRLREAYDNAKAAGLWRGTYAGSNFNEYWAEGVQSWFDDNRENDAQHNHVNTRAELKEYDPGLATLCAEVFGDLPWRFVKAKARPADERRHLKGFDFAAAPRFKWRESPVTPKPRVVLQTELGEIEVELDYERAPETVTNFLRYVREGYYRNGQFFRSVTLSNQPNDSVKIEVVQAQADPAKENELFPPIKLETTRMTRLKHLDGTLTMARAEPDSAQDSFSICIGDQPELDFGGRRNPDGKGFAAFGRVIRGMDVVRQIHAQPVEGQRITPPVRILGAYRTE